MILPQSRILFFSAAAGQSTSFPGQMPAAAWDRCWSAWRWMAPAFWDPVAFLNSQGVACFVPFILAAFVVTQGVRRAMYMSGKLQTLGITREESQGVIRSAGMRQHAGHFIVGEQARN